MDSREKTTDCLAIARVVALLQQVTPTEAESILQRLDHSQAVQIRASMQSADNQNRQTADRTFAFLTNVSQEKLFVAIMRERPQTVAILLSVMPPALAPRVIQALSETRRIEVLAKLSALPCVPGEMVDELVVGLEQRIKKVCSQDRSASDGLQRVANILKACDRETETSILHSMATDDRALMEEIQQMLFRFDDIASLCDDELRSLTKNVALETWAVALKRTEAAVRERVFASLSIRAIQHVRAEMDYLGHVSPSEIDRAQQNIVGVARQLQQPMPIRRAA